MTVQIRLKPLMASLFISLGTGGASALLTRGSMQVYDTLKKPPASPPAGVFPVVWTILFILMGISAYLVFVSLSTERKKALQLYALSLCLNFLWPVLFFVLKAYLMAFLWLCLLWWVIVRMIRAFYRCRKSAGILQLPYLLWVTFAGYLNLAIFFMN